MKESAKPYFWISGPPAVGRMKTHGSDPITLGQVIDLTPAQLDFYLGRGYEYKPAFDEDATDEVTDEKPKAKKKSSRKRKEKKSSD